MNTRTVRPCNCGSGRPRHELRDAAGIFYRYVCSTCESKVKAGANPAIFEAGTQYALTGEEQDIGFNPLER